MSRGKGLIAKIYSVDVSTLTLEELREAQRLLKLRLSIFTGPAEKGTEKKLIEVEKALRRKE